MKPVDIAAVAVDAESGAPLVLLREREAPHRLLPILIGASDAAAIVYPASGRRADRPLTADLLTDVLVQLDATVETVEVTDIRDGTFYARLNLHSAAGDHSLDARPSDAIAVALRVDAPVMVSEELLDEAGALPPEIEGAPLSTAAIDETVDEFRDFLADVDPAQFELDEATEPWSDVEEENE